MKPLFLTFERVRTFALVGITIVTLGNCAGMAAMALTMTAVAARPLPVVVKDAQGRAMIVRTQTTPGSEQPDVFKEHFVKVFVKRWVAIDSATVEDDIAASLNLMEGSWKKAIVKGKKRLERRRKLSLQHANVRARPGAKTVYQVSEGEGGNLYGVAHGPMIIEPRLSSLQQEGEDSPKEVRWFYTWLKFRPRGAHVHNPYGFEVTAEETRWFESEALLKAHLQSEVQP